MPQEPFVDLLVGIGPAPGVVPDTRVDGQLRFFPARFFDLIDHQFAESGLHHSIGSAVKLSKELESLQKRMDWVHGWKPEPQDAPVEWRQVMKSKLTSFYKRADDKIIEE